MQNNAQRSLNFFASFMQFKQKQTGRHTLPAADIEWEHEYGAEKGRDAMNTSIYQNIATRTAGDIYIGVVGPVRTGKSTFIKRFMETQIIPSIDNVYRKERARDELPQSGSGRTIMTAEPKFVPEEAAQIQLPDGASFSVRLIDCVDKLVHGTV